MSCQSRCSGQGPDWILVTGIRVDATTVVVAAAPRVRLSVTRYCDVAAASMGF